MENIGNSKNNWVQVKRKEKKQQNVSIIRHDHFEDDANNLKVDKGTKENDEKYSCYYQNKYIGKSNKSKK